MRRDLLIFLILELMAGLLALVSFRLIEPRWVAAMVAGSGFVVVGVWMVLRTLRWTKRFRYLTFYFARLHLWLFALPMLLVRLKYLGHDFKDLHFLGMPGPTFHRISEVVYLAMVAATVIDWLRVRAAQRQTDSGRTSGA